MNRVTSAGDGTEKKSAVKETIEVIKTVVYALLIALVVRTLLFQPYTIPSASMEPNLYQGDYIIVSKWSYGYSRHSIIFSPPLFKGRVFFHQPSRGDIIVFKLPRDGHTDYIKRLIGLPGDRVQMRDGWLYVNGQKLAEQPLKTVAVDDRGIPETALWANETNIDGRTYKIQIHGRHEQADNTGVYVVPPHCYFMMGDNRDNSADSRFDPGLAPDDPKLGGCGWDTSLDAAVGYGTGVGFVPEDNLVGKAQIILLSWKSTASLFKPWTWLELRPGRFFRLLH
ncbi:MAG TPA: signal peptidase I [Caulobacteraceae bacterium]|nr:signal peptidase I [Caulobacteraceae bacterium]